jgi:hypothetical protein
MGSLMAMKERCRKRDVLLETLNIIFSGDVHQLEPVWGEGKKPVYAEDCHEFKDWVNCFVEVSGMHCFKDPVEHRA